MRDDSCEQKCSLFEYALLPLKERLKKYWVEGMIPEFYGTVTEELAPKVQRYLRNPDRFIKNCPSWFCLSDEDCEDLFNEALEGFLKIPDNKRAEIENPEGYIWQSAKYAAMRFLKEKTESGGVEYKDNVHLRPSDGADNEGDHSSTEASPRNKEIQDAGAPMGPLPVKEVDGEAAADEINIDDEADMTNSAVILIESLNEDIEADGQPWAVDVVHEALRILSPSEQDAVKSLLIFGPEYTASEALLDSGMNRNTFRSRKKRALDKMKKIIPQIIRNKGIRLRNPEAFGIFEEKGLFPSDDDDTGLGTE